MTRRSGQLRVFDFTGGLNTKSPSTSVDINQSIDLDNINILPSGGFEGRNGNTAFCTAMNSGASVHGLGYFRKANTNDFLVSVAGDKIYKSDALDGTMDDVTGSVTVTAGGYGYNNIWTFTSMNDIIIGVGGAPDAPFTYSGSGNCAALGGTPPSGNFGIMLNGYMFIGNTSSNPSRLQWSVFGNPADWSGTGSGTQDIAANDGDVLIGAAPLANNRLILFKQNSIHELSVNSPPFPVMPKFKGYGAVSKRGIVNVGDMIYFVTPQPRMKATDGYKIYDFPDLIDPVWDGLVKSRLQYLQGFHYPRLNQIWWIATNGTSTTNDYCIIWDINRKCWLRHTTGYKMNCVCLAQDRTPYGGNYAGIIYQLDKASTYSDASETSPGKIKSYWRTGWIDFQSMLNSKTIPYIDLNYKVQTGGNFDFGYGYDFCQDKEIFTIPQVATGATWDVGIFDSAVFGGQSISVQRVWPKGHGKYVNFLVRKKNENETLSFNGFEMPIKQGESALIR